MLAVLLVIDPAVFRSNVGPPLRAFPLLWSIIGGVLFVAIIHLISRR